MDRLDEYIRKQRETEPSPYLVSKIMARLERPQQQRRVLVWQSLAVAASVAVVVMLGITIGSGYKSVSYLSINDDQIENFSILMTDDNK